MDIELIMAAMFSPPYGDSTLSNVRNGHDITFSPPLRGWYGNKIMTNEQIQVFAPLRGWYTKYITEYRKMEELNA